MKIHNPDSLQADLNLSVYKNRIENFLDNFLSSKNFNSTLLAAIRYSVLNAGKRIRPLLVYVIGETLGASLQQLDASAAAIELIHCYSLIHDDLPAMDNDDLRRGKPTCHKAFNEATAILAGDALQSLAFELLSDPTLNPLSSTQQIKMVNILAKASGISGMVGGQQLDIYFSEHNSQTISIEMLSTMHQQKTGALIQAALQLGIIAANCQDLEIVILLKKYAENLGLAFQVQDDILDVEGDVALLGKNPGQDAALNKQTFTALLGLEAAKAYMNKLYQNAIDNIEALENIKGLPIQTIQALTTNLLQRQT